MPDAVQPAGTPASGNAIAGTPASGSAIADALAAAKGGTASPDPAAGAPASGSPQNGQQAAASKDPNATPAAAAGEIKLTLPKDSPLTEDHLKQVTEFAKENGLTQAQAEKILVRDHSYAVGSVQAQKQANERAIQELSQAADQGFKAWTADPDFGGKNLQQSNLDAGRVLAKFADPQFLQWLQEHPAGKALGSDPYFMRTFARIGAAFMREDSGGGSPQSRSGEQPRGNVSISALNDLWYPNGQLGSPSQPK